ncbi:MAG: biopolymer transporter ExbD [Polyangiaceae bacterium]|nr:biopolymer transporter ExbD [Polyangiaceae bacterium]
MNGSAGTARIASSNVWAVSALLVLVACGDEPKAGATSASAQTATATTPAPTASAAPAGSAKFPQVLVDDQGPVVHGQRSFPDKEGGLAKLKKDVAELPIDGKEVPITIEKKAKLKDVVALVDALGEKGAPTVRITADSRGDLPKEIVVVPQAKMVGTPPPCSVVAIITKTFESDVWTIQGTTAKKGPKGFAGPDMTLAGETLQKELKKCDSKYAFFSADDTLTWDYAHMIGGAIRAADADKKIEHLVLLSEVPVPGRAVKEVLPK